MKLLAKFNLILGLVLGAGLAIAAVVSHRFLQNDAREEVMRQARLMMEAMRSARDYTTKQIKPLLVNQQEHLRSFLPQTVPAFAATENFALHSGALSGLRLQRGDPEPDEPARPRGGLGGGHHQLLSEPSGWTEDHGGRAGHSHRAIALPRAADFADPPCLECHSLPRAAPAAMIRRYGSNNGFGWQLNEIVGAQIVSVPEAVPIRMADQAFQTLVIYLTAIFLASLILLDVVLLFAVVRPLRTLSTMADQISVGQMDMPELPIRGKDEIAVLAGSFNRMRRSLERALKMLGSYEDRCYARATLRAGPS